MKLSTRLNLAFAMMLTLVIAVGAAGLINVWRIKVGSAEIGSRWLPNMQLMAELRASANGARRDALALTAADAQRRPVLQDRRSKAIEQRLLPSLKAYGERLQSPEEHQAFEVMSARLKASMALDEQLVGMVLRGDEGKDIDALATGASDAAFVDYTKALTALSRLNDDAVAAQSEQSQRSYDTAMKSSLALVLAASLLAAWLAWRIKRAVMRPLQAAIRIAQAVSEGNLTVKADERADAELSQLLRALSAMAQNLQGIVTDVRQRSESVARGSEQISTGNADLRQRTEQQAASLQETAAAMEQLLVTVQTTAATARQADELAAAAAGAADQGGAVVAELVQTMQEIAASSLRISDITSVIDAIAFQTNILALNAAVEAARAGEQGRGFAVVASEVRALAQRSAIAAREIKSLIGSSADKVEVGSRQAEAAGESMSEIVGQARRVSSLIAEISAAASEQTTGIAQVGTAVSHLDHVTQQNASLVEQSAAASDGLREEAQRLSGLVAVFKITEASSAAHGAAVRAEQP